MMPSSTSRLVSRAREFTRGASFSTITVASLVLLGWWLDLPLLTSVIPEAATMKPLTAVCFVLAGLSLWLQCIPPDLPYSRARALGAGACAVAVASVGLLTAAALLGDLRLPLEDLLWQENLAATQAAHPGRMAPASAAAFLLLGLTLAGLDTTTRRGHRPAEYGALGVLCIGWLALLGYVYDMYALYQTRFYISMAFHTALLFVLLGCGVLWARPERGLMATITTMHGGGWMARRLLPVALVLPAVLDWLKSAGEQAGLYDTVLGGALSTMANMGIVSFMVWLSARSLNRAEETLRRQARLIEIAFDAILVWEWEGGIVFWNQGATDLYGFSAEQALGRVNHHLLQTSCPAGMPACLATLQQTGAWRGVLQHRTRSGAYIEVESRQRLVHEADGRLIVVETNRDITERRRAERRLQAQFARLELLNQLTRGMSERQDLPSILQVVLRHLEDHLPLDFCTVWAYDPLEPVLTVTQVGPQSAARAQDLNLLGQARVAIDPNGMARCVRGHLVYEPDLTSVDFPLMQRLLQGGLHAVVLVPLVVEGTVMSVLIAARCQPHSFSSGDCEFLRQVSDHVALATHQAQLHSALQEAYDDLQQTQAAIIEQERLRALGQMASGIAHDINNALSPAALYLEALLEREPQLSSRARHQLEVIQRAVDDVTATIARLRELYRPDEAATDLVPLQLNDVILQVIDLTRARWSTMPQERGTMITLQSTLAPDLPLVLGLDSALRQALINLVFNAVDAMPDGGVLTLRTFLTTEARFGSTSLRYVQVEVTDTGVGMDTDTQRRCLEPFFTTKGAQGTGLGLAMVYGIVQRHAAEMEISSRSGHGTTVRLRFVVPTTPGARAIQPPDPALVPSSLRLLVVDDDPLLLTTLRETLEADGHLVVAAPGGQEGLEAFQSAQARGEPFAVVLTDLGMPHVDGRQVARGVKAMSPTTPVLLLTGWGQRLIADREIPPHVDQVLNKPPRLRDLRAALAPYDPAARV